MTYAEWSAMSEAAANDSLVDDSLAFDPDNWSCLNGKLKGIEKAYEMLLSLPIACEEA